jgi:hypothetical protein
MSKNAGHIIGAGPNLGSSSTKTRSSPSCNRMPKIPASRSQSGGSRSLGGAVLNVAPVKSIGSSGTPPHSRVKDRVRLDTSSTRITPRSPGQDVDLSHSSVLNIFQFLSILNPSRDDMMFALWTRDYGFASAVAVGKSLGWECSELIRSIQAIFHGRGRLDRTPGPPKPPV